MSSVDFSTSTLLQRVRYRAVLSDTERALAQMIRMIQRELNNGPASLADELFYQQELARLESKVTLLRVAREAFETGRASSNPPGPAAVKRAEELAQQVSTLIVQAGRVSDGIDLATEAFKLLNRIQEA